MAQFFECKKCGTIVGLVHEGKCLPSCCDEPMEEMLAHEADEEGQEKHVPLVHEEDGKVYVKVGSTLHPMDQDHYIDWIYLLTDKGAQRKVLHPGVSPEVIFYISDDEVVLDVEAHCTKHGLWKASL
jgi:superoxide reductase